MASSDILDAMNSVHSAHKAITEHMQNLQQLMAGHKDSMLKFTTSAGQARRQADQPGIPAEQKNALLQIASQHEIMAGRHRLAPVKMRTAYNSLEQSKWRFNDALQEMGKHAIPRGVPVILHDAANKLNFANQQLNHESVVQAYGAKSPFTNSDTHHIVRQIAAMPSFRNGKR